MKTINTDITEILTANNCGLKNLEKLGISRENNLLILTGISGSGKTTLASELGSLENAEVIHLDEYLDSLIGFSSDCQFSKWINSRRPVLRCCFNEGYFTQRLIKWFFEELFLYAESQYPNRIVIAEGLHWIDPNTAFLKSIIEDKPIAVCVVDVLTATKRSKNRSDSSFDSWQLIWNNNAKELLL